MKTEQTANEYVNLGKSSKSRNADMMPGGEPQYPNLNIDHHDVPSLKNHKMGDVGHAHIKFKLNAKRGGLDITHFKHITSGVDSGLDHKAPEAK